MSRALERERRRTVAARDAAILSGAGESTEVPVGRANGLDAGCVVNCDNIVTVPASALGRQIGALTASQEEALTGAIRAAFDLD